MDLEELDLGTELFVRHARKDGRTVVSLRGLDRGESCVVEVEVFPAGGLSQEPMPLGPYSFASLDEAVRFTEEALLALEYLGCSVHTGPAEDVAP